MPHQRATEFIAIDTSAQTLRLRGAWTVFEADVIRAVMRGHKKDLQGMSATSPSLRVDLTDYGQAVEALRGADAVVHLAAIPAPDLLACEPGREPVDAEGLGALEQRDRAVLDAVLRGRTRDVLGAATDVRNQGRPSGLPTLVVLSELVTGLRGEALAYALAPVPGPAPGWAGLAGARFSAH